MGKTSAVVASLPPDFVRLSSTFKYKHIGEFLKERRLASKISQVELGEALGYSPQFICNWERGASNPPLKVVPEIVNFLKIPKNEWVAIDLCLYYRNLKKTLK